MRAQVANLGLLGGVLLWLLRLKSNGTLMTLLPDCILQAGIGLIYADLATLVVARRDAEN